MGLSHGALYLVLILDSVLLGPLLRSCLFYGLRLSVVAEPAKNPDHVLTGFGLFLGASLVQFLVLLCLARALSARSFGWLLPYLIWKPLTVLAGAALLGLFFFEDRVHLMTDQNMGHLPRDVLVPIDRYGFVNHAFGFVFNTYGAKMDYVEFRNEVIVPPMAGGLFLGLVSIAVAVTAGCGYRLAKSAAGASSVDLEEAEAAYMRQYEMTHLANGASSNRQRS